MIEPSWLIEARKDIGQREIKGVTHNPRIVAFWMAIKRGGIKTDEVPWCAAFVGAKLEAAGIQSTRFESAESYTKWGSNLNKPALGCVVVFRRPGGHHVGFVVGMNADGQLQVLGGNQHDMVCIREFDPARVEALRWPLGVPLTDCALPIFSTSQSQGEA